MIVALSKLKLGDVCAAKGQLELALAYFQEAADLLEQRGIAKPDSDANVRALATCYVKIAKCLAAQGQLEDALATVLRAQTAVRKQIERQPADHLLQRDLAWIEANAHELAASGALR